MAETTYLRAIRLKYGISLLELERAQQPQQSIFKRAGVGKCQAHGEK